MNLDQELSKIGVKPKKGQNFLTHKPTIKALVESGELDDHKTLEIGGGLGAITEQLTKKTKDLSVVEMDDTLARHLEEKFPDINVLNEDFLEMELGKFERCVSNIPFEISSDIIKKLGEAQIQSSLIVQDDLADKIVLDPGEPDYGYFTALVNYYFVPVKLRSINSSAFYPKPDVDAAMIKLYPGKHRYKVDNEEILLSTIKALFTHKRKKLRNALVDSRNILGVKKNEIKPLRDEVPYSEDRVINLDIRKLAEVSEWIESEF